MNSFLFDVSMRRYVRAHVHASCTRLLGLPVRAATKGKKREKKIFKKKEKEKTRRRTRAVKKESAAKWSKCQRLIASMRCFHVNVLELSSIALFIYIRILWLTIINIYSRIITLNGVSRRQFCFTKLSRQLCPALKFIKHNESYKV